MWQITYWCGWLLTDVANYLLMRLITYLCGKLLTDVANYWLMWQITYWCGKLLTDVANYVQVPLRWQFYEWRGNYMSDMAIMSMTLRILDIYERIKFASMEAPCLTFQLPTLNCSAAPWSFRSAPSSKCTMKYSNHLDPVLSSWTRHKYSILNPSWYWYI